MDQQREEKALREFKEQLADLTLLLRHATGADTVSLHWVNRSRQQFVLESHDTTRQQVLFPDRVAFQDHLLDRFRDIEQPVEVEASRSDTSLLPHHPDPTGVNHLMVVPFVNNGETVALTLLEQRNPFVLQQMDPVLKAYRNSLANLLNTYLELTDLHAGQREWGSYEEQLNRLSPRLHRMEILQRAMETMQSLLPGGGVSLIVRGMGVWINALNASEYSESPAIGQMIDEGSLAYESLKKGEPAFAVHFNHTPKRITRDELQTEGATLAMPLIFDGRRHATLVAYSGDALHFRESVRHKLTNLVRVASLSIQTHLGSEDPDRELFSASHGLLIPDLWERTVQSVIRNSPQGQIWFGLLTIANLSELRSRHRLEVLSDLQKELVTSLNPSRFGRTGFLGYHSDYVYVFILHEPEGRPPDGWVAEANRRLQTPVRVSTGEEIQLSLTAGYTKVEPSDEDYHPVVQRAKKALNHAVRESVEVTEQRG